MSNLSSSILHTGLRLLLLLFLVVVFAYVLLSWSPLDPINAYLGGNVFAVSEAQKSLLVSQLALDQSVGERLMHWLSGLMQGELGYSSLYQQPVSSVIAEQLPLSLLLIGLSWICSLVFGYLLGLVAAIYRGGWLDRIIQKLAWLMVCMPSFWLAMLLISLFSIGLSLTPVCCAAPIGMTFMDQSLGSMVLHLMLPVATLTLVSMAPIMLHTREKVIDVLQSDYVQYSLAHGDSLSRVVLFHVIRNSLLPAIILQFATIAELFGGSLIAETVFSFPGLGAGIVKAGLASDTALLMGCTLISALLVFSGNLIANLLSGYFMLEANDV
ncbi:ABC transporter permease [Shewanella pealeana]|uniref:Binding-protein-dependent transport systems inner membrane component n=1 Tax=Shewanella pealeana (strain ATCC 700345 / ANG-SQ1) TaxID=398579 RepID=A8H8R7_SHEPA|nr:ABC transporter permease [Shewanella pealeana]ABV88954.1 binding-protein-dependent transport systems inner membrane component [Shewanella pealeana ATCC 700345]